MMHRRWRYDVMLCIMMLLVLLAMMRCLLQNISEAVIIGEVNIICRRQTSFKKVTFVGRQK